MFGGGRRRGMDSGTPSTQPQSPVQQAIADLRSTLDDDSATADQIKSKLDTLRQARAEAKVELGKAEDDLRSLLTQRQEASLVIDGILD
jgi:chromosome segregation ATPase